MKGPLNYPPRRYKRLGLTKGWTNSRTGVAEYYVLRCKVMRKYINLLKDQPCTDCNQRFPSCAMDFDHIEGKKLFNVSSLAYKNRSLTNLLNEAAKCEVVCANCHRIRTYLRRAAVQRKK